MNFVKSKINLDKSIDLYISNSGYFYVSGSLGILSNKLFFSFDLNSNKFKRSFKNSSIRHLFSTLKFNISSVTTGYYIFIDLVGLGYKIKKITSLIYRFYLGQSHYIYFFVSRDVLF